jgi:hypothetical protein
MDLVAFIYLYSYLTHYKINFLWAELKAFQFIYEVLHYLAICHTLYYGAAQGVVYI